MGYNILVVMYHYVRDLKNSRFPEIKGLDINLFRQQIEFLKSKFNIISMEQLIDSIDNRTTLPEKSALLTFDDGFLDHYTNVFPILFENKLQGSFYVPGKILSDGKILDVHKIHFILASTEINKIVNDIFRLLDFYRGQEFNIASNEFLYNKLAVANRFDNKDTIFVKRLLQAELPEKLRTTLADNLFSQYITPDEESFSKEIYMSYDQLKVMKNSGMHFGIHGYNHYWLDKLPIEEAKNDIKNALDFYTDIIDKNKWTISYPYGSHNNEIVNYIKSINCKIGFTTEVRCADLSADSSLTLPRLDTNDFPPKSNNYTDLYK